MDINGDGSTIVLGSPDEKNVQVWIKEKGVNGHFKKIRIRMGKMDRLCDLQISPDGSCVAAVPFNGKVQLWVKGSSGEFIEDKTFKHAHLEWSHIKFSSDGRYLAFSGGLPGREDRNIEIREVQSGKELNHIKMEGDIKKISFTSEDQGLVALVEQDFPHTVGTSHLQTVRAGTRKKEEPVPPAQPAGATGPDWKEATVNEVFAAAMCFNHADMSSDGQYMISSTSGLIDQIVSVWKKGADGKFAVFQQFDVARLFLGGAVSCVRFSPDGMHAFIGSTHGGIRELKRIRQEPNAPFIAGREYFTPAVVTSINFSMDGRWLLETDADGSFRVQVYEGPAHMQIFGFQMIKKAHKEPVFSAAMRNDNECIVTAGGDGKAIVWKSRKKDGQFVKRQVLKGHTGKLYCAQFSPDGTFIATGGQDGTCRLWKLDGRGHYVPYKTLSHPAEIYSIVFSADGKSLATSGRISVVKLWDVESGKLLKNAPIAGGDARVMCNFFDQEIPVVSMATLTNSILQTIRPGTGVPAAANVQRQIPGWRFLQEGVREDQAPFDLRKYLRYIKPEQAEFLVERETPAVKKEKVLHRIENVELARLILLARLMRGEVNKKDLRLEDVDKLLNKGTIKNADLEAKREEIRKVVKGQEDSFCLFLRELIQNSVDAIATEIPKKLFADFKGLFGQGFQTLFGDFDEVRVKTSLGDGTAYHLTLVRETDKKTGEMIITIAKIEAVEQKEGEVSPPAGEIDVRSYIPKGKKEWIVSVTDPVGMDLYTIVNYVLTPDESLKRQKKASAKPAKFWKGTEIQRVKYFKESADEVQLDALIACEALILYTGAVDPAQAKIYYNRFPEDAESGEQINEAKEKLATVATPQGDLTVSWCKKRKYHRITHKDLYIADPEDHRAPDGTQFIPRILLDELCRQGLAIDIPPAMQPIRARNALADEQTHLLPLKKAIAVGTMKASLYLMLKHGIYLPTLPQDFFATVTQPFEYQLDERNIEIAERINAGKWDEIPSGTFEYLADPAHFHDLMQVMRNVQVEWMDDQGKKHTASLEEQRREIFAAAKKAASKDMWEELFDKMKEQMEGIHPDIAARMRASFGIAHRDLTADPVEHEYSDRDVAGSPVLSACKRLMDLLARAMDSAWIENRFEYAGKPDFGGQEQSAMIWNARALDRSGWVENLIDLIDGKKKWEEEDLYDFIVWSVEQTMSHEYRHVYEIRDWHLAMLKDSHQAEKGIEGAFGYEQRQLLRKIIKNRFHVPELIRQLRREFSAKKCLVRFGAEEWDVSRLSESGRRGGFAGPAEPEEISRSL